MQANHPSFDVMGLLIQHNTRWAVSKYNENQIVYAQGDSARRRPRIWFSRSRLILTSNARLASSALTAWLSRSLTRTSLKPAGLHDAGYAGRIIAVALIDLHLEHRLGMARIDADHRQAESFELGP